MIRPASSPHSRDDSERFTPAHRERYLGHFPAARSCVLGEVAATVGAVRAEQAVALLGEIGAADRVYLLGAGRSRLAAEGFAMRLVHVGVTAHVAQEVTAPAAGEGDLLIACSGSGATPTVLALAESARAAGARVAAVTGDPAAALAEAADLVVDVTEHETAGRPGSEQFVGTLFEQCALLLFDVLILTLERSGAADPDYMSAQHTNLE
ncbi:6-phospho-3-hexuloisomerase [Actinomadura flavalba]|uniref:6-phospho-3-hexuloisomerase n=1 Tax=Actinomadura flavalba TaxID=1120938 RepID=UPI00036A4B6A|nr:6-phospho-3-hexuloisomerase [Actinomadura flavalba]